MANCNYFRALAKNTIEIQGFTDTSDDYGGSIRTWETAYTVHAVIEPASGISPREAIIDNKIKESRIIGKITIRYISALANTKEASKYRIKFEDRYFNIIAVVNLEELNGNFEGKRFQKFFVEQWEGE